MANKPEATIVATDWKALEDRERKWLDELSESQERIAVEITTRIVLRDEDDLDYLQELLDKNREFGSCVITRKEILKCPK